MSKIQSISEKVPKMNEDWLRVLAGESFDSNDLQNGNMEWGPYPYLPVRTIANRFGSLPIVTDASGQMAGFLFPIDENGKTQYYLAPLRHAAPYPLLDDVLSPYHFIFGGHTSSSDWNRSWESQLGPLKLNGVDLAEAVRGLESRQLSLGL